MTTADSTQRSPVPPLPGGSLLHIAPVTAALAVTMVATSAVSAILIGPGADYSAIFPPTWFGLLGAGLLGTAVLLRAASPGRLAQMTAWLAALVLLGASGGVLLDCFRAFFAVTGIPAGDFSEVDVAGAVTRASALGASFSAVLLARRIRIEAGPARRAVSDRSRQMVGLLGVLLCVPYPLLKLVWWLQGEDGSFSVGFPGMELVLFAIAAAVLIGLTVERTPDTVRVPLLIAGWGGGSALLSMGALMVFGLLAQMTGIAASPLALGDPSRIAFVTAVYGTWLLLGAALIAATVLYGEARPVGRPRGQSHE
ncbi:hypothetical protein [Cumulibacter soli]|uniref:hypothetical protein n=1 Tax=Cumulibacter soli TaxID=2546344 RepID=UPI001067296D|nr:hypothetical protein [Cumulibacter soli]